MNTNRARIEMPLLLILVCATCSACTFKVLDSATDLPIVGVDVHAEEHGMLPGIGHPAEFTLWWWNTKTDEGGEFTIPSSDASIDLSKDGYVEIQTLQAYRRYKSPTNERARVFYLTKQFDEVSERVKYLIEKTNDEIKQYNIDLENRGGNTFALPSPHTGIAVNYGETKSRVRNGRDWKALMELCQFAPYMKAQRDAGGSNVSSLDSVQKDTESLIRDCESRR